MRRYLILLLLTCSAILGKAAPQTDSPATSVVPDSVQMLVDSLIRELQEVKLQELTMRDKLDASGQTAYEDSVRKVQQQQRIDSLRRITPGVPLVVEGDTLLYIYASLGGEDAVHRVESAIRKITNVGKSLRPVADSLHIFESDYTADIMCGEMVLLRVSDLDGLWSGLSRSELAELQKDILSKEIQKLQSQYGMQAKLHGFGWALFLIVVQIIFFLLTVWFIRRLRHRILWDAGGKIKPLVIKDYELLSIQQVKRILLFLTRVLQVVLVIFQLIISLPLLFSIFPETEKFTWNMINYVWEPLRDMAIAIFYYIPNLVRIIVVIWAVRLMLRGLRHLTDAIASGSLKFDRFYQDWAEPTYQIIRIFIITFTLVVIWPWLPGSDTGIFKGVSIFVAALFSLGSTTTVGNLISGIIITYMRPFIVGDYVRIGEREGEVVEKNAFITRLKDIKGNLITVPNNSILSQQTVNYTAALRHGEGSIVHSDFTFTYKVPRATIESYLLEGASRCSLLMKEPKPFVLVTALEDFYTRYEINGYTKETDRLFEVYSEMHKHIIDVFLEHDLDPTSSHFVKMEEINKKL
ncbi:MAG: mechanosensitive ion channel [Prevotella sp.]|nr:mechanosensitive ion channel [Prevotella sp.]